MISPHALDAERALAFTAVGNALPLYDWPGVPVRWNRRLRRAGRAVIEHRGEAVRATIELSPAYFEVYPEDLQGILIHEAVHVGLAFLRRPFGHGPVFRRVCLEAGGRLHSRPMPGRVWRYRCPICSETLERRRRPSGDRWCARCAAEAGATGEPPFVESRALVLVGIRFLGRESGIGSGTDGSRHLLSDLKAPPI